MRDIVFPAGNEAAFAEMALRLGYSSLMLLYPFGKEPKSLPSLGLPVSLGVVCRPEQVEAAKRKGLFVVVESSSQDRAVLERRPSPDAVLGLERVEVKDRLHQRAGNLNEVVARLFRERGVRILVSLASLLDSPASRRAQLLGRIAWNAVLCRKFGVGLEFASFARSPFMMRSPHDIASLSRLLGIQK